MTLTPITDALEASENPMAAPNWLRWEVEDDGLGICTSTGHSIGAMFTKEAAQEVVNAHNAVLTRVQADDFLKSTREPTERSSDGS